ncbi:hypothetical protein [Acidovorax cavernicola]|uniref:Uncharacterized protein n=1 Tax=Acidovorax cavernicola TaxID=1675792 RepID=A0A9X8GV21_9BURK|nr:hypothetical protein [Acidovorax cavernicola]RIX79331.1 hypothetical protein D3H34_14605 [Acidovorax cavernicola]
MGMQDRDWYRDEIQRRRMEEERAERSKPKKRSGPRIPVDLLDNANPRKLWGADWHWSLQLLVWLCIAVLLLLAYRLIQ